MATFDGVKRKSGRITPAVHVPSAAAEDVNDIAPAAAAVEEPAPVPELEPPLERPGPTESDVVRTYDINRPPPRPSVPPAL